MLQAILGLRADAPHQRLYVNPTLPRWLPAIELRHLQIGPCLLALRFWREGNHSRWEVLEMTAEPGVKEEEMIQVVDEPEHANEASTSTLGIM
jgi:hypothetical protein